jgi:septal ring factor EnvC (AmiA/AmiB activator)
LIAEVLAALQRIGHHPPPAVFAGAQDALESVRTAMTLGAVLPEMRVETETLMTELSGLVRVRQELAIERDRQATEIAELAVAQKRMAALVEAPEASAESTCHGRRAPARARPWRARPIISKI